MQTTLHIQKRIASRKNNNKPWHSKETVEKIRLKSIEQYKHLPKKIKIKKTRKHSEEWKRKMSVKMKLIGNKPPVKYGKNNNRFGKTPKHPKKHKYKNIYFRSSWEMQFAKFLDSRNLHWQYEPKRFYFEKYTYLPDFYVEEWVSYVEIKGWLKDIDIEKMKTFVNETDEELILADAELLKKLNII
jgi:hypothetical protein